MSRSTERVLEEAHLSGDLKLNGRKLKEFPSTDKYDLNDTVFADLSRNRFIEVPAEITNFWCLEHLKLHHNTIRSVPDSVTFLQSLVYLDLGHNQLNALPSSVCHLPLEVLLVSNNKLQNLPSELGYCKTLTELDVSCNQINRLPPQLGLLHSLRSLNIRSNLLLEIPIELTYLKLTRLDISRNRIARLPVELKNMASSLEILRLSDNPLMAPPAVVCVRGMVHVFKWLELRNSKQQKKEGSFQAESKNGRRKFGELPKNQQFDTNNIDWAYLNIDPAIQIYCPADEKFLLSRNVEKRSFESPDVDGKTNMKNISKGRDVHCVSIQKSSSCDNSSEKGHPQTYREYKESLRLQRNVDSIYKCSSKEIVSPTKQTVQEAIPENKVPASQPMTKSVLIKENVLSEKVNIAQNSRIKCRSSSNDLPFDKMQFTMRREFEKAKEEAELIRQLRSTIESRLKVALPEDLSSALSDGVVLCHFANHIMPHSVGSIHVPSPMVPKLTTPRSRRNVDNFLEACRKIGIEEASLCNRNDILDMKENILPSVATIIQNLLEKSEKRFFDSNECPNETWAQNHNRASKLVCCARDILEGKGLAQIAITVSELLRYYSKSGSQDSTV